MDVKELLESCNESELIESARKQGLGRVRRGIAKEELIAIVIGDIPVRQSHLAGTTQSRLMLAEFIHNPSAFPPNPRYDKNWELIRSQLPGCNGICHTYNCSEGRHADCYSSNEQHVLRSR